MHYGIIIFIFLPAFLCLEIPLKLSSISLYKYNTTSLFSSLNPSGNVTFTSQKLLSIEITAGSSNQTFSLIFNTDSVKILFPQMGSQDKFPF